MNFYFLFLTISILLGSIKCEAKLVIDKITEKHLRGYLSKNIIEQELNTEHIRINKINEESKIQTFEVKPKTTDGELLQKAQETTDESGNFIQLSDELKDNKFFNILLNDCKNRSRRQVRNYNLRRPGTDATVRPTRIPSFDGMEPSRVGDVWIILGVVIVCVFAVIFLCCIMIIYSN